MARMGKPRLYDTPEEFEEAAFDYIEWVKNNPVEKTITASFQGDISYRKVPHTRGMTQHGLASHMGIGLSTLKDYGNRPEYSAIFERVDAIMKAWNLDGALSGDLNHALVARIDGHTDKTETDITTNGESVNKPLMGKDEFKQIAKEVLNEI
ncbi:MULTISPECIES: terminase small subunit [Enterobacteriaceae]|uniref:terminase small subunit n=1 Tax=Enterobacteriaceae TaxID=543 RepID=UPI002E2A5778|nr:terminase small subunit [Klebsiella pneumoniae]MED6004919.1 terminase small subunit [Klebsiella pneumoniae]MED6058267.1 terminase small subunit [Klebsiella pneumoniae]